MFGFKKKFLAFSLVELMVIFSIIGLISTLALVSVKKFNQVDKYLYSRAYDALWTASYNAMAEMNSMGIDTPEKLCKGVTKYINSLPATNPKAGEEYQGGFDQGYCNDITTRATAATDDFRPGKMLPDFIANNGMKFFITDKITESNVKDFENVKSDINYYIVYVDTDGDRGQGTVSSGNVIAFAVTENAVLIPLGVPAYNKDYLTVRVIFPETKLHPEERASEAVTYFEAIHKAWGGRQSFDDPRTIDFNKFDTLKNSPIIANVKFPTAAETPEQLDDCICDRIPKEDGGDGVNCLTTTLDVDKFDCDINIQRYY